MATMVAGISLRGPVVSSHRTFSVAKRASLPKLKLRSELSFVTSQLSGLKISSTHFSSSAAPLSVPFKPSLQPVARRICPFTGKKSNRANKVSHSNHKTKKLQFVNLQYKRIWWEAGKRYVKLRLSTKAIKTIEKNGLDAVAKKAGIDLSKK
ncbi:large ribosomal subunit protein bL28c-like [Nicotiana tabacum]|uniref:Large ribosomal subunit protein bL28c n=2 Tax=Nicotiana TaxID=4085 RepID=A0A1S3WXY7_TOBAC|nr:PREDICTED: 50S ribosomal protein L28, chloroplastic [Nicotiana sylvestris]XP_016432533.1 PREDICTED: 50S ribosomal protein L28, chloroplastic-like [Nicotiana tabacum]